MINKFLARNEEEVEYFTKMDEERYLLEAEIYGNKTEFNDEDDSGSINYRLMSEEEIPKWFV